jgi:hypothetical protein
VAVRARRFFHVFEHFHRLIRIESSLPTNVAVQIMFDRTPDSFWHRWVDVHGYGTEAATPRDTQSESREPDEAPLAAAEAAAEEKRVSEPRPSQPPQNSFVAEVGRCIIPGVTDAVGDDWRLEVVSGLPGTTDAAVMRFVSAADQRSMVFLIEARNEERQAYARTAQFNVSYLSEFAGNQGTFDKPLMDLLIGAIAASENRWTDSAAAV